MKVIKTIKDMQAWSRETHRDGLTIGLVPTMGYLHEGHLSLIRIARDKCDRVAVSIFVNPAQFGPAEDLDKYPRDFERDERACRKEGVTAVFCPSNDEMYRPYHKTYVVTEDLSRTLCGVSRPTHFRGVTTVVAKLFNIVHPDTAVFGQKDAQQFIIIRRMVEDLNFNINLIMAPTIRESDGLAMSSRNKYLNPREREEATVLHRSLLLAESEYRSGNHDFNAIRETMKQLIETKSSGKIDYIEIVDADRLSRDLHDGHPILIALAVYFGKARLIDNIILYSNATNSVKKQKLF